MQSTEKESLAPQPQMEKKTQKEQRQTGPPRKHNGKRRLLGSREPQARPLAAPPPCPAAGDPKWSCAALGATYPQLGPLSRYITRPGALLLPSIGSRETAVSPGSLPASGERARAPSEPAGTREPLRETRRRAAEPGGHREGGGGRVRPGAPRSPAARPRSAPFGPAPLAAPSPPAAPSPSCAPSPAPQCPAKPAADSPEPRSPGPVPDQTW